jgi:uncharacterized repeat protein (TIGR02543 family)
MTGLVPQASAATPKKAVYILPGFMGSRLFGRMSLNTDLWFNPITMLTDIAIDAIGLRPEMANDSTGVGMVAYANRNIDKLGLFGNYLTMINSINTSLALNKMSDMYKVEFFSYNWLQDLNTSAKELAADIKAKGYQNVIFVTHSNGGLLASTFIAQSAANKKIVEKAIMLATPLLGTFISLEGLETGSVNLFDGTALMGLADFAYDIFIFPLTKRWVKSWARSSPNMHQLTAGNEYIQKVPVFYRTTAGMKAITNPADYYALLKSSPGTNNNLVDGNARSLKYLRETVFKKDVLSLWEGIDLTLIGCEYGFITATSAIYRQVGNKAIYAGTIYSTAGDWVAPGISVKGDGRFPFVNLPGSQHVLINKDPRALSTINQIITGGPLSRFTTYESSINQTSSILPAVGMSDMVRVSIMGNDPLAPNLTNSGISMNVYDSKGRMVARANGEAQTGFSANNFAYQAWDTSEYSTNILAYIPLNGYSMEVFSGNAIRLASNIRVITEELDTSGAVLSRNEYKLTGANLLTGSIFTLNGGKSLKPETKTGVTLTTLSTAKFKQNWKFTSNIITLTKGATATPAVTGPDASSMVRSNYTWTSSNTSVASVSSTGVITAVSPGSAIITAAAKDDSYKVESITMSTAITVTFNAQGGVPEPAVATVNYGTKVSKPADPIKTGFAFAGWYNGSTAYDFNKVVTANLTLTAKWTQITCTVAFDSQGGTAKAAAKVNYGAKVSKPALNPIKIGSTFVGWYLNGIPYDFNAPVTSDITLKAVWR